MCKKKIERGRNWGTISYDSIEVILKKARALNIPMFISPAHKCDRTDEGAIKKEHRHLAFMLQGVKTREQMQKIIDEIGGVGIEPIHAIRSYARYLCHLDDNSEISEDSTKIKYDINDVISLGGADYLATISLPGDKYTVIAEILDYIFDSGTESYADLLMYAKENRKDWFRVICDKGTPVICNFLKSLTWTRTKYRNKWHNKRPDESEESII